MRLLKLGLIFSLLTIFAIACANNQPATNQTANNQSTTTNQTANKPAEVVANKTTLPVNDEFASVRKHYAEKCVKCHKEDGTGGDSDFDGEKIKVPSFKAEKVMKGSDDKYIDYITNGDDGMPAFKDKLTGQEIKDLVKMIRKDFQGK